MYQKDLKQQEGGGGLFLLFSFNTEYVGCILIFGIYNIITNIIYLIITSLYRSLSLDNLVIAGGRALL